MSELKGRTIKIFLADGSPSGVLAAEIMNWTGKVIVAPRSSLPELAKRTDTGKPGVYFLSGPDPTDESRAMVYIGESDNVASRVVQHSKDDSKDFWDRACLVVSKDENLTKTHIRFLESRLISLSAEAGRVSLLNGTAPIYSNLPESDLADMEYFIEQIQMILPVIGFQFLRRSPRVSTHSDVSAVQTAFSEDNAVFILERVGAHAKIDLPPQNRSMLSERIFDTLSVRLPNLGGYA